MSEYYAVQRSEEYLEHYGVLGMKWGMRKAAKKGTSYTYQSHATKKYKKAAAKLMAKGNTKKASVMANRAKRSAEIDRGEQEYAKNISTKKAIGLALLGTPDTLKGYAQNRAMEKQTGKKATGKKVTAGVLAAWTGSTGSRLRKAAYIRQDENRKGLGQKIRNFDTKVRDLASVGAEHTINSVRKIRTQKKNSATKAKRSAARKQALKDGLKSAALSTVMGPAAASVVATRRAANEIPARNARHKPKRR